MTTYNYRRANTLRKNPFILTLFMWLLVCSRQKLFLSLSVRVCMLWLLLNNPRCARHWTSAVYRDFAFFIAVFDILQGAQNLGTFHLHVLGADTFVRLLSWTVFCILHGTYDWGSCCPLIFMLSCLRHSRLSIQRGNYCLTLSILSCLQYSSLTTGFRCCLLFIVYFEVGVWYSQLE